MVGELMSGWGQSFGRFFLTVPCLLGGGICPSTVEMARLSMDPQGLLYVLVLEKVPLPPAELSRLLKASVVFLTRTLSEPIRRKPAAASFSAARFRLAVISANRKRK